MANNQKQILFFNSQSISLVVISFIANQKHLCFFQEIKLDKNFDIKSQILKLKIMAENYLYQTINEVDLIIDNKNISQISGVNEIYTDCTNEEDLLMEVTKKLNNENCFVNNVVFKNTIFDNNAKQMITSFDAYVLDADFVKQFYLACTQIGLKVITIKNILSTFACNSTNSETVMHFDDDNNLQVIQYKQKKINKIISTRKKYYDFIVLLAKKIKVTANEVENLLDIANLLVKNSTIDKENIDISTQFGKTFFDVRKITLATFLTQIKNAFFMYLDQQNISLSVTQNKVSIYGKHQNIFNYLCTMINNFQSQATYIIGQNKMKLSQQISIANLDNNLQKDPMEILRTKNIKSSLPFLDVTNNDDLTLKS